jgi:hypothetical protein
MAWASSGVFIRAPMDKTWALLWVRASWASLDVVGQSRPDTPDLVRGHLLTVSGPAQHDAERSDVAGHRLRRTQHRNRIVVLVIEVHGPWSTTS